MLFLLRFLPFGEMVRHNLKIAFPSISSMQLDEIEKGYYKRACDFAAEFFHLCKKDSTFPVIDFENIDALEDSFKSSQFIVCYSGHFANYELLTKLPFLHEDITMYDFYQPSSLTDIDSYICKIRARYGAKLVPTDKGCKEIIALKNNSEDKNVVIGALADLKKFGHSPNMNLFGRAYTAYTGTERIGELLEANFFYAKITSPRRGHYKVKFIPLEQAGYGTQCSATEAFFRCLEDNIRTQPELWMLWGAYALE